MAKLKQDIILYDSPGGVDLRRLYNSQRRILIAHAHFLASRYQHLVRDIDCNLLAGAYQSVGDYEKAESYWEKIIKKSLSNPIRHMSLRGYARFLFFQGKFQLGRSKYEEALQIDLSDTDDNRRIISDTYFTWAETEQEFGNFSETERLIVLGQSYSNRIGHAKMKEEMQKRFEKFRLNIKSHISPSDVTS